MAIAVSGPAWHAEQPPSFTTPALAARCSGRLRATASRADAGLFDEAGSTPVGAGVDGIVESADRMSGLLNFFAQSIGVSSAGDRNDASAPCASRRRTRRASGRSVATAH